MRIPGVQQTPGATASVWRREGHNKAIQLYQTFRVPYSHDKAAAVRQERSNNNHWEPKVNYASLSIGGGAPTVMQSNYAVAHSEPLLIGNAKISRWQAQHQQLVRQEQVDAVVKGPPLRLQFPGQKLVVYTERQPCGSCTPLLQAELADNDEVYYTVALSTKEDMAQALTECLEPYRWEKEHSQELAMVAEMSTPSSQEFAYPPLPDINNNNNNALPSSPQIFVTPPPSPALAALPPVDPNQAKAEAIVAKVFEVLFKNDILAQPHFVPWERWVGTFHAWVLQVIESTNDWVSLDDLIGIYP
ncbi:MAG TPA: hypothetical protein VI636_03350 [Candidatus Angelobacter sp.]